MPQVFVNVGFGFLAGLLFLSISPAIAQQGAHTAQCTGPFSKDADEARLNKAFGSGNVIRSQIHVGEGFNESGNVVFPKDPKRSVYVLWHDKRKRRRPAAIIFPPGSDWQIQLRADQPIGIGTSLDAIEVMNGRAFTLYGFAWEHGGEVANWNGGVLDRPNPKDCIIVLRFEPHPETSSADFDPVVGDGDFSSADPKMKATRPSIAEMTLRWPQ